MGFVSRFDGRLRNGKRNYPAAAYMDKMETQSEHKMENEKRSDTGGFSIPDFQNFLWKLWNFQDAADFDNTANYKATNSEKRSNSNDIKNNNDGFKPDNVMDMVTEFKTEKPQKSSSPATKPKKLSKRVEMDIPRFASIGDRIKMISELHRNKELKMNERSQSKNDSVEKALSRIIRSYLLNLADLF